MRDLLTHPFLSGIADDLPRAGLVKPAVIPLGHFPHDDTITDAPNAEHAGADPQQHHNHLIHT